MFGLPIIDIVVIGAYLLFIILLGFWCSRHIKNQEDYFLAGRRFGKFVQVFATFSQGTSSESPVGQTVMVARNGMAGFTQAMLWTLGQPLNFFISLWYRRLRYITFAEFFKERYGSKTQAMFYSIVSSILFVLIIGLGMKALTTTIAGIVNKPVEMLSVEEHQQYQLAVELGKLENTDARFLTETQKARLEQLKLENPKMEHSYINETAFLWICAVVVIVYAVMGGLEAAFLSDTLQGAGIIILSLIMAPFAFFKINHLYGGSGLSGVVEIARSKLPESSFDIWGSTAMVDFTWYYLIALFVMLWINCTVLANQITVTGSAKNEFTARFGFTAGHYIRRACHLFWGVTALMIVILYSGIVKNPDYLWGYACRDLLGPLNIGLVGLMIACLMAAMMSTADALMLTASGLLTNGCIKMLYPDISEKKSVLSGRLLGILIIAGAAIIAMIFVNVMQMLKFFWEYNNILAASFLVGLKWRRATRVGAWSSMIGAFLLFLALPLLIPLIPGVRTNKYLLKTTKSKTLLNVYTARQVDVEQRLKEIELWSKLDAIGKAEYQKPEELAIGQKFEKEYITPKKSIFWTGGIKQAKNGNLTGVGKLNIELVLLDQLGINLANNPYALNETIRLIYQTILPFLIIIIASLLTKPDDKQRLDRFFVKMKTPVLADRVAEKRELEISYANPTRFDNNKLFPNTNLEFEKFNDEDWKGLIWCCITGGIIFGIFILIVQIGK